MSRVGHVTQRHLLRRSCAMPLSPLQFLRTVRLERAPVDRRGTSVGRAAEVAGFRSTLPLRRAWRSSGAVRARCADLVVRASGIKGRAESAGARSF
jgi:transcriptional regulator GlxA family with amidase domain